jgi:MFS family permease
VIYNVIQLGCLVALLGCGLQTGANGLGTLLAGRVIAGFAIGILSMVVPLYNAEIAPPSSRGFIVGLAQLQIGIGFVVAQWGGYGCSFLEGDKQWRIQLGIQMVPAFILLVGIHFLPFSPASCFIAFLYVAISPFFSGGLLNKTETMRRLLSFYNFMPQVDIPRNSQRRNLRL